MVELDLNSHHPDSQSLSESLEQKSSTPESKSIDSTDKAKIVQKEIDTAIGNVTGTVTIGMLPKEVFEMVEKISVQHDASHKAYKELSCAYNQLANKFSRDAEVKSGGKDDSLFIYRASKSRKSKVSEKQKDKTKGKLSRDGMRFDHPFNADPLHAVLLYVAARFPEVSPIEFKEIVNCLLKEIQMEAEAALPVQISNQVASAHPVPPALPKPPSPFIRWNSRHDQCLREAGLIVKLKVTFHSETWRQTVVDYFSGEGCFSDRSYFETLWMSGFLFHSAEAIRDQMVELVLTLVRADSGESSSRFLNDLSDWLAPFSPGGKESIFSAISTLKPNSITEIYITVAKIIDGYQNTEDLKQEAGDSKKLVTSWLIRIAQVKPKAAVAIVFQIEETPLSVKMSWLRDMLRRFPRSDELRYFVGFAIYQWFSDDSSFSEIWLLLGKWISDTTTTSNGQSPSASVAVDFLREFLINSVASTQENHTLWSILAINRPLPRRGQTELFQERAWEYVLSLLADPQLLIQESPSQSSQTEVSLPFFLALSREKFTDFGPLGCLLRSSSSQVSASGLDLLIEFCAIEHTVESQNASSESGRLSLAVRLIGQLSRVEQLAVFDYFGTVGKILLEVHSTMVSERLRLREPSTFHDGAIRVLANRRNALNTIIAELKKNLNF